MDLSLDEIIKRKKALFALNKNEGRTVRRHFKNAGKGNAEIKDARMKIIQKNRAKIRDARDKLAELTRINGDVRKKLEQKQQDIKSDSNTRFKTMRLRSGKKALNNAHKLGSKTKRTDSYPYRKEIVRPSQRQNLISIPRGYVDYDNMEDMEHEEFDAVPRLSRTVKNDLPPPAPRRLNSWGAPSDVHYDPFDVYELPVENRRNRNISPDLAPSNRERSRSPIDYQRRYVPEASSHLSYEMRTRLERAPDPHASMGIFSNPINQNSTVPTTSSGYRIVVSNLHTSVTQADIQELFEDIGELYDARIVRPGVAEVVYKSLVDAENAVDNYHNRQLDGQPMKCLLVNPRVSSKPTAPAICSSSSQSSKKLLWK